MNGRTFLDQGEATYNPPPQRSLAEDIPWIPNWSLGEHILGWLAAFPDLRWEIDSVVAQGERVVTWAMAHGTHQGGWLGIAPTGRRVAILCVVLHRVADGRIVEDWVVTEALGLFQQLGLVPDTPTLIANAAGR